MIVMAGVDRRRLRRGVVTQVLGPHGRAVSSMLRAARKIQA
jgi:hypothetical protein